MQKNSFLRLTVILSIVCLFMLNAYIFGQGAAINTTGSAADASAILDVSSNSAGILIPRMTRNDRNSISSPAEGLLIYQTDDSVGFWYYGGPWKLIGSGGGSAMSAGTNTGNTLYWNGTSWVASSNIYNDNAEGSVSIGTNATPDASASLELGGVSKGLLINRMNITERDAIQNPAEGLQIFNTETNCLEIFITPLWQNIYCGCLPPATPTAVTAAIFQTEITWNWTTVAGASGYKYNTTNNYSTATSTAFTTYTQSGLACETSCTLYVWAENNCSHSNELEITETTGLCWSCGDNFTDNRDSKTYTTVKIGNQCWMKENLNYDAANSWCYDNNTSNCNTYGRLYDWVAATTACPLGWKLPSDAEWSELTDYLSLPGNSTYQCSGVSSQIAKSLASTSLWSSNATTCSVGNNVSTNNSTGFTAIPGGYQITGGTFNRLGNGSYWWSATEDDPKAWCRRLYYNSVEVSRYTEEKGYGFSVRCLKN